MEKHSTKLIDGKFTLVEAKKLLSQLLSYKINYHQMEKFGHEERFGTVGEHSAKRIKELTEEKTALANWLSSLGEEKKISITCNIQLKTIEDEKASK